MNEVSHVGWAGGSVCLWGAWRQWLCGVNRGRVVGQCVADDPPDFHVVTDGPVEPFGEPLFACPAAVVSVTSKRGVAMCGCRGGGEAAAGAMSSTVGGRPWHSPRRTGCRRGAPVLALCPPRQVTLKTLSF